jgi:hypothetical protein
MFLQNTGANILRGVETQNIMRVEEAAQRDINVQAYWYRLHDIFLFMQGNFIRQQGNKRACYSLLTLSLQPSWGGGEAAHACTSTQSTDFQVNFTLQAERKHM